MNRTARYSLLSLLTLSLAACNGSSSDGDERGDSSGAPAEGVSEDVAPAAMLASLPFASTSLGALHGVIGVKGDVPERFPIGARKKSECTHHADVEHLSDIVVANQGRLKYAFVRIVAGHEGADVPPAPATPLVVDQRGCIYTPHVTALQAGQQLWIANSDPTTHNVNLSAPGNRTTRNVAMVQGQAPLEYDFKRADRVELRCDIHPWMSALVHVSKHPWFAVTDDEGAFSIPDVPPGRYVVEVQHEEFGSLRGSVVVEAGSSAGVSFEFDVD